jgi:thiol-disulfide isomerase/thioredoxin
MESGSPSADGRATTRSGAHLVRAFESVPADIARALRGRIRTQALTIWKEIGGSEEGFASLRAVAVKSEDTKWKVVQRIMPPLQRVRFEGKTTFVNVWATWCGPCQAELPQVQRLHDMFRGRKDVAVITLNIDENSGLVEPYMKQRGFRFAVEFAREIVERDLKVETIPRNWIIDRKGVIRLG